MSTTDPPSSNAPREERRALLLSALAMTAGATCDTKAESWPALGSGFAVFESAEAFVAARAPSNVEAVRVLGRYRPGDGGEGTYVRLHRAPEMEIGALTSEDGARWSLCERRISPEMFGARGDGITDDYPAFLAMRNHAQWRRVAEIAFSPGRTYLLGRNVGPGRAPEECLAFRHLDGLRIDGHGSVVVVKGGFERTSREMRTLQGLTLFHCDKFEVRNLTLDGSNRTIEHRLKIDEANCHGLTIGSCVDGLIENVETRYWMSDGLAIGGSEAPVDGHWRSSRRISVRNVDSHHNGRQALTISQLRGGMFSNCDFNDTGQSSYGFHSPANGVDIEPDRFTTSPGVAMDVDTADLTFDNCRFLNNWGQAAGCSVRPRLNGNFRFTCCTFDVGAQNHSPFSPYGILLEADNVTIEDCDIDLRDRVNYLGFNSVEAGNYRFVNNTVKGRGTLLRTLVDVPILVEGNRFISTRSAPVPKDYVIWLRSKHARFVDNHVFIPGAAYVERSTRGGWDYKVAFQGCRRTSGNTYATDLASGVHGDAHFVIGYEGVASVENEMFLGASPGSADTIRPGAGVGVDTRRVVSRNAESVFAAPDGVASRAPSKGVWSKGAVVRNDNPAPYGPAGARRVTFGWICVEGGEPGTWTALQAPTGD